MTFARILLLCLILVGCGHRRATVPDWVRSAPPGAATAISCRADWALEQPRLQGLLAGAPLAGGAMAVLLQRAGLETRHETGRITLFLNGPASGPAGTSAARPDQNFLIQLGRFRDPGRLQVAVANAFPAEGSLTLEQRDYPLFVILDLPPSHVRAMADGDGRVWLGDVAALGGLETAAGHCRPALAASSRWLTGTAAVQGFILPPEVREDTSGRLPGDLARDLPRGIEALCWSLNPGSGPNATCGFELCLAGSPEAIQRAASWLDRFVAATMARPGTAPETPEILQERRRIGLRCQLSQEQVDLVLAKLDQPPIRFQ
jgi:hypothetical protein